MAIFDLMRGATPAHATDPNRFRTTCPFCGKENHFYFNTKTKKGICFKCMTEPIFLGPDFLPDKSKRTHVIANLDDLKDFALRTFNKGIQSENDIDIDLFSEPIDRIRHPRSYEYVTKVRGLSDYEIRKYDIRSGKTYTDEETGRMVSKWIGRVIFPFYEEDRCVYAIGRSYTGNERKYVNVDVPNSEIVYGINEVSNRECIICEGLLSSIAAEKYSGISSVCLLGKTISQAQAQKIKRKADRVWQCLDGGVPEKQVRAMSRSLIKAGFKEVWRVNLPDDSDPDELGDDFLDYFKHATRVQLI